MHNILVFIYINTTTKKTGNLSRFQNNNSELSDNLSIADNHLLTAFMFPYFVRTSSVDKLFFKASVFLPPLLRYPSFLSYA